jgi:hypothetical protein
MSFGSSKSKTSTNSNTQTEPWAPSIGGLKGFINKAESIGNIDITPDQQLAFQTLKNSAAQGNPFTPDIAKLATDSFNYDNSGQGQGIKDAYATLQGQLGATANGQGVNPFDDPRMAEMLKTVGDDVQWRINRMFAGAGRDLSGANQGAVSRGVTQAQLPLLLDQFNRNQDRQTDAAKTLYGAAESGSGQQSQLDALMQSIRGQGVEFGNQALNAKNFAANTILDLDQQIQQLPYENLALLGSLLLPASGVGGTSATQGTSKSKSSGFGISLSDERAKDDIAQVGELVDGQPVYRFSYKDDPHGKIHIGLMAQDVEETHPEAVVELPSGYKGVDYGQATKDAAKMVRAAMDKRRGN